MAHGSGPYHSANSTPRLTLLFCSCVLVGCGSSSPASSTSRASSTGGSSSSAAGAGGNSSSVAGAGDSSTSAAGTVGTAGAGNSPACGSCCAELSNPDARACDVLLEASTQQRVTFEKAVRGSSQQRGSKLAIAFTGKNDTPLSGPLMTFSGVNGAPCDLRLTSCTCYDRTGHTIDGASVTFHGSKQ